MSVDMEIIVDEVNGKAKQELRLWLRLLSTTKMISQEIRRRLRAEFDVTLPQFDLLAQLYREPDGLRLGELSKRTMVTNGNVTGLVERLEKEGLVHREKLGEDRRVSVARLTEKGSNSFSIMAAAHENWLRELMSDLPAGSLNDLLGDVELLKTSAAKHLSRTDD